MRRGLFAAIVTLGLLAPAMAAERPPFRQQCVGTWTTDGRVDWGTSWWYHFGGMISCGFDAPVNLPSQMYLRVPKDQCNAGKADGNLEVRANGEDVWVRIDQLDWVPGAGALVLTYPAGHGVAWVSPYWSSTPATDCPTTYVITAAFVYNSLDGTKLPSGR